MSRPTIVQPLCHLSLLPNFKYDQRPVYFNGYIVESNSRRKLKQSKFNEYITLENSIATLRQSKFNEYISREKPNANINGTRLLAPSAV